MSCRPVETSSAAGPCQAAGSYQPAAPFPSGPSVAAGVAVVEAAGSTSVAAVVVGAAGIAAATSSSVRATTKNIPKR